MKLSKFSINSAFSMLITIVLMLVLFACSCSAGSDGQQQAEMSIQQQLEQPSVNLSSQLAEALASPSKLTNTNEGYAYQHDGSGYEHSLANQCVNPSGLNALFSPDYIAENQVFENLAFGHFLLLSNPQVNSATLEFSWNGIKPDSSDLWIGLSNWNADRWDFVSPVNVDSHTIEMSSYRTNENETVVIVVLTGSESATLARIKLDDEPTGLTYPIVDTNQTAYYSDSAILMGVPGTNDPFYGQDAQYSGNQPSYYDNGDGTVSDNVTGLMWQQTPDLDNKISFNNSFTYAETLSLGGYTDWRVPTIKELYSLILFDGETGASEFDSIPYLDTDFFDFVYGDESAGERFIDAQYWSSTEYGSTTMTGNATVFGVNFADGRIKGYPKTDPGNGNADKLMFLRCVRGNPLYGINSFTDNDDNTITDQNTGLMWSKQDSGHMDVDTVNWEDALSFAEGSDLAGYTDWRLPNAKELESIVDYTRCLDVTSSAAIDPVFESSTITDEGSNLNYAFYWSSTTHLDGMNHGSQGCYLAFGEALGFLEMPPNSGNRQLVDVHGAGAQRSDPKTGDPADYPFGRGPQGDVIRIFNMVRLVRDV